jgi:hypothetical protein
MTIVVKEKDINQTFAILMDMKHINKQAWFPYVCYLVQM